MEGTQNPVVSRSVEEVFGDFRGRRAGLLKALSTGLSLFLFEVNCFLKRLKQSTVLFCVHVQLGYLHTLRIQFALSLIAIC